MLQNKKTDIYQINVPIYKKTFFLVNEKKSYSILYEKYNGETVDLHGCDGICSEIGTGYFLLGVFDGKISTLIHELTHLSFHLLHNGDTYDIRQNDEQLAYLIEYLTDRCLKKLGVSNKCF